MNEATAIALGYGIFRRNEFDATPKNVAFVDFGHSHLSVFIAGFTKDKLTIPIKSMRETSVSEIWIGLFLSTTQRDSLNKMD